MGFFDEAFSSLKEIVANGAGEHADAVHSALQNAASNPQELGDLVGRLSNHPEIGQQVQSWLENPAAKQVLARFVPQNDAG